MQFKTTAEIEQLRKNYQIQTHGFLTVQHWPTLPVLDIDETDSLIFSDLMNYANKAQLKRLTFAIRSCQVVSDLSESYIINYTKNAFDEMPEFNRSLCCSMLALRIVYPAKFAAFTGHVIDKLADEEWYMAYLAEYISPRNNPSWEMTETESIETPKNQPLITVYDSERATIKRNKLIDQKQIIEQKRQVYEDTRVSSRDAIAQWQNCVAIARVEYRDARELYKEIKRTHA